MFRNICRRSSLFAAALFALALPLAAQEAAAAAEPAAATAPAADPALVTPAAVAEHLERTRSLFLAAIADLTPEQWAWKPAADRWSVAECAEHITRSESFIRDLAAGAVNEPATPEVLAKSHGKVTTLLGIIVDRSQKFQAPEPLNPMQAGELRSHAEIVRDFNFERGRTAEFAAGHPDLEAYARMHPAAQELDLAGWLYFLSGHTERHTLQIEEVKATAGFPAG